MTIKTLSSKVIYENPWLSLREDQVQRADGSTGIYSVVDKPDFSLVIPLENDGFHLVEQYRYPLQSRSWEFPSGSVPGGTADPTETAARELTEETGFQAQRLDSLGCVHCNNSLTAERVHVFLATGLRPGRPDREETEQDMRTRWFAREEVERMLRDGDITDGPTLSAYLLLSLRG